MTLSQQLLLVVVFAPLVTLAVNWVGYRRFTRGLTGSVASLGVLVSTVAAWVLYYRRPDDLMLSLYQWMDVGPLSVDIGFFVDDLTAVMFLVVTTVAFCVHLYAVEYMVDDDGFHRFFLYLNLFVFSMLILLAADNLLMLFIGWEGVGVCSYLLIGFWHEQESARDAGMKAFIVNRIGDVCFLLGMFYLVAEFGTLTFAELSGATAGAHSDTLAVAGLLFLGGAIGKSAQFPLHVWLPDAMEGPTPVSSLIHAATMVTAGVYLVARLHFIYAEVAWVGLIVAGIGAFTALFAGSMAVVARDMKQILAYSTISQLGYMFVGVGVAAYAAGIFHLVTHAFFKGLLFLVAGAVMHALHGELDIFEMGNLSRTMPLTAGLALVGGLGLAGMPPFGGFWSKEEILVAAWGAGSTPELIIFGVLLFTSLLTAFYTTRLVIVPFWGEGHTEGHEFGTWMNLPMILLAAGTVFGGLMARYTEPLHYVHVDHGPHTLITVLSILAVVVGVGGALMLYQWPVVSVDSLQSKFRPVYDVLFGEYYVDELYRNVIVQPLRRGAQLFWRLIDDLLIDGIVNLSAAAVDITGLVLRFTQTGYVRHYLFVISFGLSLILLAFTTVILL